MSTLVADARGGIAPAAEAKARRFFDRYARAREIAARRRVVAYLAAQTDERLAGLGFGAAEIGALRRGELKLPAR